MGWGEMRLDVDVGWGAFLVALERECGKERRKEGNTYSSLAYTIPPPFLVS